MSFGSSLVNLSYNPLYVPKAWPEQTRNMTFRKTIISKPQTYVCVCSGGIPEPPRTITPEYIWTFC